MKERLSAFMAEPFPGKERETREIVARRFGRDHDNPCKNPTILTCAKWECQVKNRPSGAIAMQLRPKAVKNRCQWADPNKH